MIKATEMKKGMVVVVDGNPCLVLEYQHVKLGKGGAVLQTKLKNRTIRDLKILLKSR